MARILVIDDNQSLRFMVRDSLQDAGHLVAEAENGLEGLKLCRQEPFDLVITDLVMPEKEGIETIHDLRRDFADMKIIAMSGGNAVVPMNFLPLAKTLGADEILYKPFDTVMLRAAVNQVLGARP